MKEGKSKKQKKTIMCNKEHASTENRKQKEKTRKQSIYSSAYHCSVNSHGNANVKIEHLISNARYVFYQGDFAFFNPRSFHSSFAESTYSLMKLAFIIAKTPRHLSLSRHPRHCRPFIIFSPAGCCHNHLTRHHQLGPCPYLSRPQPAILAQGG